MSDKEPSNNKSGLFSHFGIKTEKRILDDGSIFKSFYFKKNNSRIDFVKSPFYTNTSANAEINYAYSKYYYKNNVCHNENGPAVVMYQDDISHKACMWYFNGKIIKEMMSVQYDDWIKNKEKYQSILDLVLFKHLKF